MYDFHGGEIFTNFSACALAWTCSENFHKTSENSNRSNEMLERSVDHLFGRHLSDGKII